MDTVARPDGQQIRSILQILLGAEKNHLSFKILLLLSFLHISLYRALLSEIDIILKRPKTTDLLLTGTSYMSHCSSGY